MTSSETHRKATQLIPAKISEQDNEEQIKWLFQASKVFCSKFLWKKVAYFNDSQKILPKINNTSLIYITSNYNF